MNDGQLTAVRIATRAALDECRQSPVGNLLEAHMKVVVVSALLRAGYSIMEGSTRNTGKVIGLRNGRITITNEDRPTMAPAVGSEKKTLSPDLRVWGPIRMVIELQIRTVLGSQDALFSDNLVDDLDRVLRGVADAFILAADRPLYDALRGIKTDNRGRKPKHTETCSRALPDSETLGEDIPAVPGCSACGRFSSLAVLARTEFGLERVIVSLWRGGQPCAEADGEPSTTVRRLVVAEEPPLVS